MRIRLSVPAAAALAVLIFALSLPALPQQKSNQQKNNQDEAVLRISAELVQIDVVVTDRNNKPVSGLKREDFRLYDDNKLQTITHFSFEETKPRRIEDVDAAEAAPRTLTRAISASELRRVIAFVIDTAHMKYESVTYARSMLEDFVANKMERGDLVLILPTVGGSGLYQQFTSDQRLLRGAINRLRPSIGFAAGYSSMHALTAIDNVVKSMARLPGRKISMLISEGFPIFDPQSLDSGLVQRVRDTITRAAHSNVVFYSINPGGLDTLEVTADYNPSDITRGPIDIDINSPTGLAMPSSRPGTLGAARRRAHFDNQAVLNALAVDTGGKFFRNTNDLNRSIGQMLEANSAYYMLGFQPEASKWDGKYHKVKVVLRNRPDLKVTTRKGYVARTETVAARQISDPKIAEIAEAITSPIVRREIDLQLTPLYKDDSSQNPVLTMLLHIDAARLSFKPIEGRHKTDLEMTGFVFDSNGKPVDRFSQDINLSLQPQTYQEVLKHGLLSSRTLNIKPGVYQLRVFVREADSGLVGTVSNYVEVPDLKASKLALSSIFTDTQFAQGDLKAAETGGEGGTLAQRRFKRSGQFAYLLVVYNASTEAGSDKTQLEMTTRVLKAGEVVFKGQPRPVQMADGSNPPSRIITGGILQLGSLAPDTYTLEVVIVDKLRKGDGNVAQQQIDFSVE